MRKIYQSAPDVPQVIANKAVEIIERHLTASGVRRAEELPEESKVHLLRELQKFFQSELPPQVVGKEGELTYSWGSRHRDRFVSAVLRWLERMFGFRDSTV